ncbi:MAG: DUF3810 domain-containing protein [Phaeodactylibacter sp.]|uniref:DUF3810 domain-containing protein n=1 Tax=Phaeodactylibacter sp. TaxID=1940289 RepID=UPI0032EC29FA
MNRYKSSLIWLGLGIVAVILRLGLSGSPEWIEHYYSRGLFLGIRTFVDHTVAMLPFPVLYLVVFGVLFTAFAKIRKWWQMPIPRLQKWAHTGMGLLGFSGGAVFFFLLLWGYNYGRVPVEQQLALQLRPLSAEALKAELLDEAEYIINLRARIPGVGTSAIDATFLPENLEGELRADLETVLDELDFPTVGEVRAKRIYPKGIFLRFSSSGMYFPWSGEGQVDAGLDPLSIVSVMAHELAHGYGFGDEGTCNFWAYVACAASEDPFIAYAGHLDHFRTLAAHYLRYDREAYFQLRAELPAGIQADLDAINENLRKYPDIMPELRYAAYDTYLKAQGIEEGIKNYSRVVMMVKAWKEARKL